MEEDPNFIIERNFALKIASGFFISDVSQLEP
jgi:hypothetical protein